MTILSKEKSATLFFFLCGCIFASPSLHRCRKKGLSTHAPILSLFCIQIPCFATRAQEYNRGGCCRSTVGFHSFIDGVIYSIAFTVSIFTGVLATMGMVLHEFPEGIIT
jgi:zinc transporter ZupT